MDTTLLAARRIARTHTVAQYLGVTPARVRAIRDRLRPTIVTVDGESLYDMADVESYAAVRQSQRTATAR